jgi:hypothetical protein
MKSLDTGERGGLGHGDGIGTHAFLVCLGGLRDMGRLPFALEEVE